VDGLSPRVDLTTGEVARALGLAKGTVCAAVRAGQLNAWRTPGGHYRIRVPDAARFAAELGYVPRPAV